MEYCYLFRREKSFSQLGNPQIGGTLEDDERVFSEEMDMNLLLRMAMASEGDGWNWHTPTKSNDKSNFAFAMKEDHYN